MPFQTAYYFDTYFNFCLKGWRNPENFFNTLNFRTCQSSPKLGAWAAFDPHLSEGVKFCTHPFCERLMLANQRSVYWIEDIKIKFGIVSI